MKYPNNNYIKKAVDLNFCLNRYIDSMVSDKKRIYIFHMDSITMDYKLYRKIFKVWANEFRRRYDCIGVGAVEHDSNGFWHSHLLVSFKFNYKKTTMNNIYSYAGELWNKYLVLYTQDKLEHKQFTHDELDLTRRGNITSYLSKALKHQRGSFTYIPKAYGQFGSFKVSLGNASALWNRSELPSCNYSVSVLKKELKEICKERRKNIFNKRYLIKNNKKNF